MYPNMRIRAVMALGIVLACCAWASALDPSLDISQYAHTAWKVRDGFARGQISSIAQTPDVCLAKTLRVRRINDFAANLRCALFAMIT